MNRLLFPEKYADIDTSNSTIDVSDPPDSITIELEGNLNKVRTSAADLEGDDLGT